MNDIFFNIGESLFILIAFIAATIVAIIGGVQIADHFEKKRRLSIAKTLKR